ncbi:peptidoglycan bridge formation glycyltransferase FemA/FemB family protein [Candidatus Daviesbacteria bacterium]|nr:peptidoglycan bridge formation glycyltransferase FemA/FemB family protein [Candidatus Daviesbacteria bacterium]
MAKLVQVLGPSQKDAYDKVAGHVIQSWQWGQFREKTGLEVVRLGVFEAGRLVAVYQMTIHPVPHTPFNIGYLPKSSIPEPELLSKLAILAKQKNIIFIKFEPNIEQNQVTLKQMDLLNNQLTKSKKTLFTKHNFLLNLIPAEDELLSQMHGKTRYNIRVAQKHKVIVEERQDDQAFDIYLKLYFATTKRQKYFGHSPLYHRLMWQTLQPEGMARILVGSYQNQPLVAWMLLKFGNTLYYPYGGSSEEHKNVMASNLIAWEAIKLGKRWGCDIFDFWGALGPDAHSADPWQGFHRFKAGYGGRLVEYVGTYDLVINQPWYHLTTAADRLRWFFLRLF